MNHVPTLTGGKGHEQLRRFYAESFIPAFPGDTITDTVHRPLTLLKQPGSIDKHASSMSLRCPLHSTDRFTRADDTRSIPVNRIVAGSAVVDEMVMEFTHDQEVSYTCLTA